jgi:CYTH domain-containing protein
MEIERKFLVKDTSFMEEAYDAKQIIQGYICADAERSVRIRICGNAACLTIKSASEGRGWSRYEFEQSLAPKDAEALMQLCLPCRIDKTRYCVQHDDYIWEVDVFHGENEGLTVAEIELASEEDDFELPSWVGKEVSDDPKYYNSMLVRHPYSTWGESP